MGSGIRASEHLESVSADSARAHLFVRAGAIFHKVEIASVLLALGLATWHILQVDQDLTSFAVVWGVICLAAAVAALWPGTPRALSIVAELVLLILAVGQLLGPHAEILPFLGREIRDAPRWNQIPLADRRILAWNIIASLSLAWLMLPVFLFLVQCRPRGAAAWIANVVVFLIIWCALALIFVLVAQAALF